MSPRREGTEPAAFDGKQFCRQLPSGPGIYRMYSAGGEVLYVGKARNLKKRVASYFSRSQTSAKTLSLVSQIQTIEITVTHTETEALILENNLIKQHKPRYNILLRDDKSYPYILLSHGGELAPRLSLYRGSRREPGRYFGPYPGAGAVRETLDMMQKLFKVRQCEDTFYRNRSRPCLQYQIKRCSAPCVKLVSDSDYARDVRHAVMFLEGRNSEVIDELAKKMEQAASTQHYEEAAHYRDQIVSLRTVQERQYISGERGDLDVIAVAVQAGVSCIDVFFIRHGHNLGNKTFYPKTPAEAEPGEILSAFLSQYYQGQLTPGEILLSTDVDEPEFIEQLLTETAGHKVRLQTRVIGERARYLDLARSNAQQNLKRHLSSRASLAQRYVLLQQALHLDALPQRLECFDISHISGQQTVASCVVFNSDGPLKSDYRRFNIDGITPGDDYAALYQALSRRYTRIKKEEGRLPDVLFIDGGTGQVAQAARVLEELQITEVTLVGVAKGRERKPGMETLLLVSRDEELHLDSDSPALHLIQQIRDEAHRYAITGHRQRRHKAQNSSTLETIPGVGSQRRRELLRQFGGLQGVSRAGVEDLMKIRGINRALAQRIYDTFHSDGH
ncbi:MAG: excinuclease ABC subunit UvrC [Gammaproteobacteria bacterium]|nr:excinuclease ABC subunit UvrC [Gammaproteobacteria bacterium]